MMMMMIYLFACRYAAAAAGAAGCSSSVLLWDVRRRSTLDDEDLELDDDDRRDIFLSRCVTQTMWASWTAAFAWPLSLCLSCQFAAYTHNTLRSVFNSVLGTIVAPRVLFFYVSVLIIYIPRTHTVYTHNRPTIKKHVRQTQRHTHVKQRNAKLRQIRGLKHILKNIRSSVGDHSINSPWVGLSEQAHQRVILFSATKSRWTWHVLNQLPFTHIVLFVLPLMVLANHLTCIFIDWTRALLSVLSIGHSTVFLEEFVELPRI